MTAQEILFEAYTQGISITADGKGNLRITPARLVNPKRIADIKAHKRELLALVTDLLRYGALDDPLILEALALFNATPKGFVKPDSVPFLEPIRPVVALAGPLSTTAGREAQQRTFWEKLR